MMNIFQHLFGPTSIKKTSKRLAWLGDLEEMDDLTALQFAAKQLTLILSQAGDEESLSLQQQLDLIFEVEALNQARLERLSTQFSNVENMKPELENNICETCYNYCRQSYIFHLKVIEKVFNAGQAKPENSIRLEGNTPMLLIARALYTAFNMVKWRMFGQSNPPAKVWQQINVLYRIAAQHMLLNNPVELFVFSPSTTLAACYVQTCMLGQLGQASMQKYHLEIATRVINAMLTRAYISNKSTPEQYLFYVDLEKDAPAKRMRDFVPNDNYRYWELDELEKLISVAITVSDRGEIPQSLAFAKIENTKKLNETLRILLEEWKKNGYVRQRRKTKRQASSKMAKVTAGIANICNQVHQANHISNGLRLSHNGASLEERVRAHTVLKQGSSLSANSGSLDTWIITDESPRGMGTRVNKYANILARPDKLIGLVVDEDYNKLILGMIRSVKPTQGSQLRVGIETISNHPTWVQLRQIRADETYVQTESVIEPRAERGAKNAAPTVDIGLFSGIYLPIEAGLSDTSMMILPKINYRTNSHYSISMNGSTKHVLLGEPVESRDDWVKVAFPV